MKAHPESLRLILIFLTIGLAMPSNIGNDRQDISLDMDGGYTNLLIAIDKGVPENLDIISKLKEYFTDASSKLLTATNNRLYFKNITILVPDTWTHNDTWSQPGDETTLDRARVVVAEANQAYKDEPYIRQPGTCGDQGDFIHFTPEYLTEKSFDDPTYRPAKRIVKEFAKLKWGLFDENIPATNMETSRLYRKENYFEAQGCVEKKTFKQKDDAFCSLENGLPPPSCDIIVTDVRGSASLLAYEYVDSVTGFCTESEVDSTHNILSTNSQNKNCNGKSAWSVMSDLEDFATDYGLNRTTMNSTEPEFLILQKESLRNDSMGPNSSSTSSPTQQNSTTGEELACPQDIVCLCLDVSASMNTANRITVMSEAVQLYILSYLRNGTAVGIVSFSDSSNLLANMTEITDDVVRESLRNYVPTNASGGTNIKAGLDECRRILGEYTGGDISNTRILLHSGGNGTSGDSMEMVLSDGVTVDAVLFGQGGYLAERAQETGGQEYYASDNRGKVGLLAFYAETASRFCEAENADSLLVNEEITIPAGDATYQGRVYFDVTIGLNTKMVFKCDVPVNITVLTSLEVSLSKDANLLTTIIIIAGQLEESVDYVITKDDPNDNASVISTVTSSPVPGVKPLRVNSRVNSKNVEFSISAKFIGYVGVFQGYSPVLQLTVLAYFEDPTGSLATIQYLDDGTGKDSIPNDGFYTGSLPSHLIGGSSESFYGLSVKISGVGVLPNNGGLSRKKRCTDCRTLGNITRSISGGVIVINNWFNASDITPPEVITDLVVLEASEDTGLITLGWTAPGEDLNMGKASGYRFRVGANYSVDDMVSLQTDAILSNISTFLVEAGSSLQLEINATAITPEMLGMEKTDNISTYYFRIRAYDSSNNYADWSNPASATYIDEATIIAIFGSGDTSSVSTFTTTTSMTTTATNTTTTTTTTTIAQASSTQKQLPILAISLGVIGFVALVIIIVVGVFYHLMRGCCRNRGVGPAKTENYVSQEPPYHQRLD